MNLPSHRPVFLELGYPVSSVGDSKEQGGMRHTHCLSPLIHRFIGGDEAGIGTLIYFFMSRLEMNAIVYL